MICLANEEVFSLIYQDLYAEEKPTKMRQKWVHLVKFPLTNAFASERISYRKFRRNSKKNFLIFLAYFIFENKKH